MVWCGIVFPCYSIINLVLCLIYCIQLHSQLVIYIQQMFGYSSIIYSIILHISNQFCIISHLVFDIFIQINLCFWFSLFLIANFLVSTEWLSRWEKSFLKSKCQWNFTLTCLTHTHFVVLDLLVVMHTHTHSCLYTHICKWI